MLFIHVGLQKTGTTFLQNNVFPKWKDLCYVQHGASFEHLLRMDETKTNLVSREGFSGPIFASHEYRDFILKKLSNFFPHARILISFRRHDSYLVSCYKQYLHKGGTLPFERFFDIENDRGFIRRDDFLFRRKIESIEKHFKREPFVFLYEEIKGNFDNLIKDMSQLFRAEGPPVNNVHRNYYNRGVKYYAAKLLIQLNKLNKTELNPRGLVSLENRFTNALKIDPRRICQYWLSFLPDRPMISKDAAKRISEYFKDDWEYVCAYARRRMNL